MRCTEEARPGHGGPPVSPPILNPHLSLTKEAALDGGHHQPSTCKRVNRTETDWGKIKWRVAPGELVFIFATAANTTPTLGTQQPLRG